jgi:hypothetical protein
VTNPTGRRIEAIFPEILPKTAAQKRVVVLVYYPFVNAGKLYAVM